MEKVASAGGRALQDRMLKGSAFYRDNPKLVCMGHPESRRPCSYEPEAVTLRAARRALSKGVLTPDEFRCIELDMRGFPGKVILKAVGCDSTGAIAKRARYACERAYAKIRRRLCFLCSLLWAAERPRGPRIDSKGDLKYAREDWAGVVRMQQQGPIRIRRSRLSLSPHDRPAK